MGLLKNKSHSPTCNRCDGLGPMARCPQAASPRSRRPGRQRRRGNKKVSSQLAARACSRYHLGPEKSKTRQSLRSNRSRQAHGVHCGHPGMSPASQGALGSAAPLRTEAQAWLRYPRRRAGRVCDAAARSPAAARAPRRAGRHLSGENLRCARRRQRPAFRVLQSGVSSGKTRLPAAKRAGDLRNTRQNSASALPLSVEPLPRSRCTSDGQELLR